VPGGRSDRSEIECEIGEVDDTYAEYPPVNDPIGSVEDTGDFSGKARWGRRED